MFYYIFEYLDSVYQLPGAGVFQYISFRSAMAAITSLIITMVFGKYFIQYLKKMQITDEIRDLGLEGQMNKKGTPTMGGIMMLAGIIIPTLLFAKLENIYVILMLLTTVWLGFVGFVDDYIKVFKKNKEGLRGKFKIIGQILLGIFVSLTLVFNDDVIIGEKIKDFQSIEEKYIQGQYKKVKFEQFSGSTKTTIPFLKNNEFDYYYLISWMGEDARKYAWIIYMIAIIFIITAVSNSVNLTDGLDGLAAGTTAIVGGTLGILAWVSGNFIFADYLNIMYLPNTGELVVFMSAYVGSCLGFLWFNTYPSQVFMGDTGSIALGGIIAVYAVAIRKELLIPLLCGIFLWESISVILQVSWFKYTKRRTGTGKRIWLMTPIHHHYQLKNLHEAKIVARFLIINILLAILTVVTLKLR